MNAVELEYKHFEAVGKPTMVIMHGFLGSSRNWITVAGDLAAHYDVYALDARNHGKSPHADEMNYEVLVDDLIQWLDNQGIEKMTFIGHSMGGKVGMRLACKSPERVERMIIADIAPRDNPDSPIGTGLESMMNLDLEAINKRSDAEEALKERIPALGMRRFLLTNLERDPEGGFKWSVNLPVLVKNFKNISASPIELGDTYTEPVLFVRGARSRFIEDENMDLIKSHFPEAELVTLQDAGHNVHIDDREGFVSAVLEFCGIDN